MTRDEAIASLARQAIEVLDLGEEEQWLPPVTDLLAGVHENVQVMTQLLAHADPATVVQNMEVYRGVARTLAMKAMILFASAPGQKDVPAPEPETSTH